MSRRMKFGRFDLAACGSFAAYAACSLVIPVVLVSLAKDLGFPLDAGGMGAGGGIEVGRTLAMITTVLTCGFLAGKWGVRIPMGVPPGVYGRRPARRGGYACCWPWPAWRVGPFWPSIQSCAADRLPAVDTTMLFILLSSAGVPGCGALTWLMGAVGDAWGLRTAFALAPVCFLLIAALMACDRLCRPVIAA